MSAMGIQYPSSQILLRNFIAEFLPKSSYKGKYSHNEFTFVYITLEKIFRVKGKIKITAEELALCLGEAGYSFYVRDKTFGRIKEVNMAILQNEKQPDSFLEYNNDMYLFVNVSSQRVSDLKKTSRSLALQKDADEIVRLTALKVKIRDFFKQDFNIKKV